MFQRVMSRVSVNSFCLPVPKSFVEEPLCDVFQKNSGSKMFKEEMGISGVSFECFFFSQCQNFSQRKPLVFL